jgi:hypothetical protein
LIQACWRITAARCGFPKNSEYLLLINRVTLEQVAQFAQSWSDG